MDGDSILAIANLPNPPLSNFADWLRDCSVVSDVIELLNKFPLASACAGFSMVQEEVEEVETADDKRMTGDDVRRLTRELDVELATFKALARKSEADQVRASMLSPLEY